MKKIFTATLLVILFATFFFAGCTRKEDPNKSTIKIEVNIKEGQKPVNPTVNGSLVSRDAKSAGFVSQIIKITPSGSMEVKGGPSEYELKLLDFNNRHHEFKLFIDGRELKRGEDMVVMDNTERGFIVTFKVEEKGETEK